MNLVDFIRESNRIEGILREPTQEEIGATLDFLNTTSLRIENFEKIVSVYAPGHRLREKTGLNVRVGNYVAPSGGPKIRSDLHKLIYDATIERSLSPWQAHVAYERLHPFTDGNGRSGRALWLWMMDGDAPLGFLHHFYYQTLAEDPARTPNPDGRGR